MITEPWNDRGCLRALHQQAREVARTEEMRSFADQFANLDQLVGYLRALPQRDDVGAEGPRLACGEVTQRVRVMPEDPNCFERTLWYLAAAENVTPAGPRSSATAATDIGLHTFPVENHDPVILDMFMAPNVLRAALDEIRALRGAEVSLIEPERLMTWFWPTALHACRDDAEVNLVQQSERRLRNGLRVGRVRIAPHAVDGMVQIARREAGLWPDGRSAVKQAGRSLRRIWSSGVLDPFIRAYALTQLGPVAGPVALQAFDAYRAQQKSAEVGRLERIVPRPKGDTWQRRRTSRGR